MPTVKTVRTKHLKVGDGDEMLEHQKALELALVKFDLAFDGFEERFARETGITVLSRKQKTNDYMSHWNMFCAGDNAITELEYTVIHAAIKYSLQASFVMNGVVHQARWTDGRMHASRTAIIETTSSESPRDVAMMVMIGGNPSAFHDNGYVDLQNMYVKKSPSVCESFIICHRVAYAGDRDPRKCSKAYSPTAQQLAIAVIVSQFWREMLDCRLVYI